jgi:DNA invertase Pin-like site-specific DNA recombinase
MTSFIAYYRVSTDRQGQSGFGLDAQRAAVAAFVQGHRGSGRGELAGEFVEVESGRKEGPSLPPRSISAAASARCWSSPNLTGWRARSP